VSFNFELIALKH